MSIEVYCNNAKHVQDDSKVQTEIESMVVRAVPRDSCQQELLVT